VSIVEPAQAQMFADDERPRAVDLTARSGSESREHQYLKYLSRNWLLQDHAWMVGIEVSFPAWSRDYPAGMPCGTDRAPACRLHHTGPIIDVLGLMSLWRAMPKTRRPVAPRWPYGLDCDTAEYKRLQAEQNAHHKALWAMHHELVTVGIEVKVSRSDFLSGYCDNVADLNWVCVCPGVCKKQDVPDHVGILQYDPRTDRNLRILKRPVRLEHCIMPGGTEYATRQIALNLCHEMHRSFFAAIEDPFYAKAVDCPHCEKGVVPRPGTKCDKCGGTGELSLKRRDGTPLPCTRCSGEGTYTKREKCRECGGKGYTIDYTTLTT